MKKPLYLLTLALALALWLSAPPAIQAQESNFDFQWVTSGSNVTQITTGTRFIYHHWYAETSIGGYHAFENREKSFFLSLSLGRRFPLSSWLYLGADLGYRHVIPDGSENPDIDTSKFFTLDARIKLEAVYNRHLSAFVGIGANQTYQGYSLGSDTISDTVIFWGVGLL